MGNTNYIWTGKNMKRRRGGSSERVTSPEEHAYNTPTTLMVVKCVYLSIFMT